MASKCFHALLAVGLAFARFNISIIRTMAFSTIELRLAFYLKSNSNFIFIFDVSHLCYLLNFFNQDIKSSKFFNFSKFIKNLTFSPPGQLILRKAFVKPRFYLFRLAKLGRGPDKRVQNLWLFTELFLHACALNIFYL